MSVLKPNNLVFLVSQPRSGSTMLQKLLGCNENIATVNEPWLTLYLLTLLEKSKGRNSDLHNTSIAMSDNEQHNQFESEYYFRKWLLDYYSGFLDTNKEFFLEKTPRNYKILPRILNAFPESKIIILKRNPKDVAASIIRTWNQYGVSHLFRNHYDDLCHAPELMQSFLEKKSSDTIREVCYEDLIKHGDRIVKDLLQWIGVDSSSSKSSVQTSAPWLTGSLGDPINARKLSTPSKIDDASKKHSPFIDAFCSGYLDHLGPEFITKYGYGSILEDGTLLKKTATFQSFLGYKDLYGSESITLPWSYCKFIFWRTRSIFETKI